MSSNVSEIASPSFWGRLAVRAFTRSWGRDVMLYTGGVSFFALLAVFPAIAILIGIYKVGLSIGPVSQQAAALADVLPHAARAIFLAEIERLASTSAGGTLRGGTYQTDGAVPKSGRYCRGSIGLMTRCVAFRPTSGV